MPKKIVVVGEILVEIMADNPGEGFSGPIGLTGPFPSGAPAIYIDQVARLRQPCAIISAVGRDDFGQLNIDRLAADGVDVSAVGLDPDRPTGSAFVRYRPDGARDFVFNIRHSACGSLPEREAAWRVVETAGHFHITGTSLSSAEFVDFNIEAAQAVRARGGTVSFDPNLRREMLDAPGLRGALMQVLALTDLFLPSGEELFLLTQATDRRGAIAELLDRGIGGIIHKLGAEGAVYHDGETCQFAPAFNVEEVDPTGAGDCFAGAFTALWLRGAAPSEALEFAAAAGAMAVTRRGPMEGACDLPTLETFIASQRRAGF